MDRSLMGRLRRQKSMEESISQALARTVTIHNSVHTIIERHGDIYQVPNVASIVRFLKLLQRASDDTLRFIEEELPDKRLLQECQDTRELVRSTISNIEHHYDLDNLDLTLRKLIETLGRIDGLLGSETRFLPSPRFKQILAWTPHKVYKKGFLFRRVSDDTFATVRSGHDIYAGHDPQISLYEHLVQRTNNPAAPFISLTSDKSAAEHFGNIIIVDWHKLRGHILTPEEVIKRVSDTRAAALIRKNTEFILAPRRGEVACIPAESLVA